MKSTIESLKDVYQALGGSLTDTYEDIADGAPVGNYVVIPDVVEAVSKKATAGGGNSDMFTVYVELNQQYTGGTVLTPSADIMEAIEDGKTIFVVMIAPNGDRYTGTTSVLSGSHIEFNSVLGMKYYKDNAKLEIDIMDLQFDANTETPSVTFNTEQYILTPLPEVTASNNGQVLTVASGKWGKADVPKELPDVTATDNGDVLKVVDGAWAKASS